MIGWIEVLGTVAEMAIDAIFPLHERAARTKSRTVADLTLSPTPHDILGTRITTLMDYNENSVRDLIQSLKYDKSNHAAKLAADAMADYLREEIASQKLFSPKRILLVPVPLHAERMRERGFNQIEKVLHALPQEFRDGTLATLAPEVLTRTRATKTQTKLSRSERLSNVAGAFAVPNARNVRDTHVFLIDDVVTTGATLANAATPLRRAGAQVTLLALARA